ncbi:MAG: Holliday junction resolvase RuvX, partial [Bacteroidota bacterium]
MARIMALDYGTVRTGIAVTDALQLIASGLATVETSKLMAFLKDYVAKEPVERLILGLPKQMDNTPSESEKDIQIFIQVLENELPELKVERQDERFTSKMAFQ